MKYKTLFLILLVTSTIDWCMAQRTGGQSNELGLNVTSYNLGGNYEKYARDQLNVVFPAGLYFIKYFGQRDSFRLKGVRGEIDGLPAHAFRVNTDVLRGVIVNNAPSAACLEYEAVATDFRISAGYQRRLFTRFVTLYLGIDLNYLYGKYRGACEENGTRIPYTQSVSKSEYGISSYLGVRKIILNKINLSVESSVSFSSVWDNINESDGREHRDAYNQYRATPLVRIGIGYLIE